MYVVRTFPSALDSLDIYVVILVGRPEMGDESEIIQIFRSFRSKPHPHGMLHRNSLNWLHFVNTSGNS